ncbi:hypothetical protein [Lysinibacillus sp. LZ02]|uniref:hypothetical protein n=1 Tax=Lysinibacillus sp. LZ02 TaxID=3420668 RepID=UPI003D36BDD9
MSNLTTETFLNCIELLKQIGRQNNLPQLVITAEEVHKLVGGYPGKNHRMPMCCNAMFKSMREGDEILHSTPSKQSNTTKIKYYL